MRVALVPRTRWNTSSGCGTKTESRSRRNLLSARISRWLMLVCPRKTAIDPARKCTSRSRQVAAQAWIYLGRRPLAGSRPRTTRRRPRCGTLSRGRPETPVRWGREKPGWLQRTSTTRNSSINSIRNRSAVRLHSKNRWSPTRHSSRCLPRGMITRRSNSRVVAASRSRRRRCTMEAREDKSGEVGDETINSTRWVPARTRRLSRPARNTTVRSRAAGAAIMVDHTSRAAAEADTHRCQRSINRSLTPSRRETAAAAWPGPVMQVV
mmetsp:Transcript_38/g.74  ORF Transcript_38/g.74 Transcript_38/m.74 type:complete len:266 (+) Transcript_38:184-981(+)